MLHENQIARLCALKSVSIVKKNLLLFLLGIGKILLVHKGNNNLGQK